MSASAAVLPRLLQLVSPSLPVGAYSYSQGLEWAVEAGWVTDVDSLRGWLRDQLHHSLQYWDLPLLARMYQTCAADNPDALAGWTDTLLAGRESAELRQEEGDRGRALHSLLDKLGMLTPDDPRDAIAACQLTGFALAAQRWHIPLSDTLTGYAWSWLENSTLNGVKLIPLGQTAGQALLLQLSAEIATCVDAALTLDDEQLGASMPALALASSHHQQQHTRLFRS
jgi:urease accessory protein